MSYKPTVAVVGLNGAVGSHLLDAFRSPFYGDKVQLPIIAVTRDASKRQSDSIVKYVTASPTDEVALAKAFKGADVVINLVGIHGSQDPIAKGAADAGVKVYFPSEYGLQRANTKYSSAFAFKEDASKYAQSLGLKTVEVSSNLFLDWVIADPNFLVLVNIPGGSYIKTDDGDQVIGGTFLADVGKALAKLSTIPASDLPSVVRIQGDSLTVNGLVEAYEKASGKKLQAIQKTLKDLTDPADKIIVDGLKKTEDFYEILKAAIASGESNFANGNENELVNPGGKDFEWSQFYPQLSKAYSK